MAFIQEDFGLVVVNPGTGTDDIIIGWNVETDSQPWGHIYDGEDTSYLEKEWNE